MFYHGYWLASGIFLVDEFVNLYIFI